MANSTIFFPSLADKLDFFWCKEYQSFNLAQRVSHDCTTTGYINNFPNRPIMPAVQLLTLICPLSRTGFLHMVSRFMRKELILFYQTRNCRTIYHSCDQIDQVNINWELLSLLKTQWNIANKRTSITANSSNTFHIFHFWNFIFLCETIHCLGLLHLCPHFFWRRRKVKLYVARIKSLQIKSWLYIIYWVSQ